MVSEDQWFSTFLSSRHTNLEIKFCGTPRYLKKRKGLFLDTYPQAGRSYALIFPVWSIGKISNRGTKKILSRAF
jgi:hypothetical protein